MNAEPNITRMDYDRSRTCAWWVRIYRLDATGAKRCHSKLFSDGVWGGRRKALLAAKLWREKALKRLPPKQRGVRGGRTVPVGYGYVKRQLMWRRVDWHPVYLGWIRTEDCGCASTSWSITRWGERGAKKRCESWLARQRRELRQRTTGKARSFPRDASRSRPRA